MAKAIDGPGTRLEWRKHQLDHAHQLLSQSLEHAQTAMKILSGLQQDATKEEGEFLKAELAVAREAVGKQG